MRKFLVNICVFIIPIVLLSYPLDLFLSYEIKNTNKCHGEFEVWNDIYNGEMDCELSIYGSSRAWGHIDPIIMEDTLNYNSYNFGIDGHNFWLQYLRHNEYLKYNSKPKIIVHSVDIFTLQKRDDLYNMSQFLPYMLWNNDLFKSISTYKGYASVDCFIPLVRFRHTSSSIKSLSKNDSPLRNKGFKGFWRKWGPHFDNAMKLNDDYTVTLDSASLNLYEQFLEECRSSNIEVIMVYTPEFIDGQKFISNRKEVIDLYNELANKYGLLFLDYSDNYLCYDKQYFYNATHLNGNGADIFTKILAQNIKAYKKTN